MIPRWLALTFISGLIFLADQSTKALIVDHLALGESWYPIPSLAGWFAITHWTNTGAAFGLFPQLGGAFTVVATIVSVGIVWYYRNLKQGDWLVRLSLGLQLGGALGNLVDRLRFGHVVDFIHFSFWPVFNLADSAIVCGVILLLWSLMKSEKKDPVPLNASREAQR